MGGGPAVSLTVNARLSSPASARGRIQDSCWPNACVTTPLASHRLITELTGLRKYRTLPALPHVAIVPIGCEYARLPSCVWRIWRWCPDVLYVRTHARDAPA